VKKYTIRKIFSILAVVVMSVFTAVPAMASQVRDNDGNAIIYGGAYSIDELNKKLDEGTGKAYQSSAQLKALFAANGIKQADFGQLKNGYVTKDNKVIVDGEVVATNVTTMGRHDIDGSKRDTRFSYPIYLRHPSVSFLSDKLPAFVSMNYDKTYAYAILKPCGNIVQGPGVKHKPVAVKTVTPAPKTPIVTQPKATTVVQATAVQPVVTHTTVTALPTSGPVEAAAGAVGLTGLSGAAYAWLKGKRALGLALRKF